MNSNYPLPPGDGSVEEGLRISLEKGSTPGSARLTVEGLEEEVVQVLLVIMSGFVVEDDG